jgi:hypothetical protein
MYTSSTYIKSVQLTGKPAYNKVGIKSLFCLINNIYLFNYIIIYT